AAMSLAARARVSLALLRAFVREIEAQNGRRDTLRGLVAPELSPGAFADALASAERREASCSGGAPAGTSRSLTPPLCRRPSAGGRAAAEARPPAPSVRSPRVPFRSSRAANHGRERSARAL